MLATRIRLVAEFAAYTLAEFNAVIDGVRERAEEEARQRELKAKEEEEARAARIAADEAAP